MTKRAYGGMPKLSSKRKLQLIALLLCLCLCLLPDVSKRAGAQSLTLAGATRQGQLFVDTAQTKALKKDDQHFLAVYAEERYTDAKFLAALTSDARFKDAVGASYIYLFDSDGTSVCIAAKFLVNAQGGVLYDCGKDLRMVRLTAQHGTLLNAYSICLKALEEKQRWLKKIK